MARAYETTFILKPEMEEEARKGLVERLKGVISNNSGEVTDVNEWGSRNLAYEIRDYKTGYYFVVKFEGETSTIEELEHNFKIIDDVLRYLIVRDEE